MNRLLCGLILLSIALANGEESNSEKNITPSRVYTYYSVCKKEDPYVFSVKLEYDIPSVSKGSEIVYFKSEKSEGLINGGGGILGIACGPKSSLFSSGSVSADDNGIELYLDLTKSGGEGTEYHLGKTHLKWTELEKTIKDERGTVRIVVTWKK